MHVAHVSSRASMCASAQIEYIVTSAVCVALVNARRACRCAGVVVCVGARGACIIGGVRAHGVATLAVSLAIAGSVRAGGCML